MNIVIDTNQILLALTAIVSAAAGAFTTSRKIARPLLGMVREWREFRDDWQGVPDRKGFKGHPGMPERMASVEAAVEATRSELVTNHGTSLKDAIRRIEAQQTVVAIHAGAPLLASPTHAATNGVAGSDAASAEQSQVRREAAA
jgi:hypothetical protein